LSRKERELIQTAGRIEVLDFPVPAEAMDHPLQERPKISIDVLLTQGLQRINKGIDFDAVRKRLFATTNEHE
jgi:hypothetical protein